MFVNLVLTGARIAELQLGNWTIEDVEQFGALLYTYFADTFDFLLFALQDAEAATGGDSGFFPRLTPIIGDSLAWVASLGAGLPGPYVASRMGALRPLAPEVGRSVSSRTAATPYPSPHWKLYLMGLIPPVEVPPVELAVNGVMVDPVIAEFTAERIDTVTIDDLIAEHGQRIPGSHESQRAFRALYVVLSSRPVERNEWGLTTHEVEEFGRARG